MAYLNGEKILFSPQVHITTPEVVQTTGDSETAVMSQKAVTEALATVGGSSENWVQLVNETLTENLATEFRQVFDKPYKKIRFKIEFKGASSTTLSQVRFKRAKADGSEVAAAYNYLKYGSGGNLGTARSLVATAFFDVDNSIVLTDVYSGTDSACALSVYGSTAYSDPKYTVEEQNFPEFYFYLGGSIADDGTLTGNVIGNGTRIQVWGCE